MLKIQLNLDKLKEWINKFQTTRHTHTTKARSSSFPLGFVDIKASCSTVATWSMLSQDNTHNLEENTH